MNKLIETDRVVWVKVVWLGPGGSVLVEQVSEGTFGLRGATLAGVPLRPEMQFPPTWCLEGSRHHAAILLRLAESANARGLKVGEVVELRRDGPAGN